MMKTPFSDLWWWQKLYFRFRFGNKIAINILKEARKLIAAGEETFVCYAIDKTTEDIGVKPRVKWKYADELTWHIGEVQKVVTYRSWLGDRNIWTIPKRNLRQERLRWLDQMINYLESK